MVLHMHYTEYNNNYKYSLEIYKYLINNIFDYILFTPILFM